VYHHLREEKMNYRGKISLGSFGGGRQSPAGRLGAGSGGKDYQGPFTDYGKKGNKSFMEMVDPKSAAQMPSAKEMNKGIRLLHKKGFMAASEYMVKQMRQRKWKQMGYNPDDWEDPNY